MARAGSRVSPRVHSEVTVSVHLPKGTRDFLPEQMHNRQAVVDKIRAVFERFGFEPLETPAIERIETLTGKYGDETDKLMYRIHKRGENAKPGECDLALRYDLTVPLARVLAMNAALRMPFKRYQIQPVWRAERPQKGRFREFWQCDVDIAGTTSHLADAECLAVADAALQALGFDDPSRAYTIRVNDRRILAEFARRAGATNAREELDVLIAIDKLDKVGRAGVEAEVQRRGFDPSGLEALWAATEAPTGDAEAVLYVLEDQLGETGRAGVATLRKVIEAAAAMGVDPARLRVDPALARGADYYTGPVFEAVVEKPDVGSIAGGGRYDGLVGALSGRDLPAVGVSLGLERILVVMEELDMLPARTTAAAVLVTVLDDSVSTYAASVAARFRAAGVPTELYLGQGSFKSQMKHANKRGYPWVALVGTDEAEAGTVTLKDVGDWSNNVTLPVDEAWGRVRDSLE